MEVRIDIKRFENKVREIEKQGLTKYGTLLYGSSFFANWGYEKAKEQLSKMGEVLNHGFGGATGEELLYYYPRLVRPYMPKRIIIRAGVNDIFKGYTPSKARDFTALIAHWSKVDFPDIKIIILAAFDVPNIARKNCVQKFREYNQLIKDYVSSETNMYVLDISPFFYCSPDDVGTFKNFKDIFFEDGLHLTDLGYTLLAEYFQTGVLDINEDKVI